MPYVSHDETGPCIADITSGTLIGYKYFAFTGKTVLTLAAKASGEFEVWADDGLLGRLEFSSREKWEKRQLPIFVRGTKALYLKYSGKAGAMLRSFSFGW